MIPQLTSLRRKEVWIAGAAAALVAAGVLLVPGGLARSVRLDPLSEAEAHISRGEYREALRLLSDLRTEGLDGWAVRKVQLGRAVCLKALEMPRGALEGFRALEKAFSGIEDYLTFWQGECYEALQRPDSAAAAYARVLDMEPRSALRDEAALRAARLNMAAGRADAAIPLYRRLLDSSGQEVQALAGMVDALDASGDSAEARRLRLRLVRDYPKAPEAVAALEALAPLESFQEQFYGAVAYAENGQSQKAIRLFRQVAGHAPDVNWRGRAQYELGLVYYNRRDYRTAERAFKKAYRTYKVPKALFDLGRCSVKFGRDFDAAKQFQTFARLYPSVSGAAEALWIAAMAYERQGRQKQAREVFLKLAVRYPRSEFADKARWRAGFALYRMGRYEEAARAFLRLSRETSENYMRDQGYYWAGKSYQRAGKEAEAGRWMRLAADGFPTSYYSSRARAVVGLDDAVYPEVPVADVADGAVAFRPSPYLVKGDLLADVGLYREAEREYVRAGWAHRDNLFALGELQRRYERIGAMNQALRVSYMMVTLEREQGTPITLTSFRRLFPTYYWGEISRTAQEMEVDPNLILAIIRQESAFDEGALSRAGARGLMQVMPATGRRMARKVRLKDFSTDDLWEPQTSIRLGARHLSDHLRYFRRSEDRRLGLALSAYNAGLNAARSWARRLPAEDVDEFVESIPYRETRNYVKLVYRNYQVYSYLQRERVPDAPLME